jgi:hypothetical protein
LPVGKVDRFRGKVGIWLGWIGAVASDLTHCAKIACANPDSYERVEFRSNLAKAQEFGKGKLRHESLGKGEAM